MYSLKEINVQERAAYSTLFRAVKDAAKYVLKTVYLRKLTEADAAIFADRWSRVMAKELVDWMSAEMEEQHSQLIDVSTAAEAKVDPLTEEFNKLTFKMPEKLKE
jgi:hypothetical protein